MTLLISRSEALKTIPPRKAAVALERTLKGCEQCGPGGVKLDYACDRCRVRNEALKRYAASNIPIRYWDLEMNDFYGDDVLLDKYKEIVSDLHTTYDDGACICFAGHHGVGKTMALDAIPFSGKRDDLHLPQELRTKSVE